MSLQTYSREYLQSLPEERKQKTIDTMVNGFIQYLKEAAAVGGTSYRCDLLVDEKGCQRNLFNPQESRLARRSLAYPNTLLSPPIISIEEVVAGFQEKFPGCKVFYEEVWVATCPNTQSLKKGVVIDWS